MQRPSLCLLLILSFMLQGCSAAKNNPPEERRDIAGVTLDILTPFGQGDGYQDIFNGLVKDFEDTTGVQVNNNSNQSNEAWKQSVIRSFDENEEPDVLFFFNGPSAEILIEQKKVIDIETIRAYHPSYAMNINLGVLNTMKAENGLNYCVPVTGFWEGLFINVDLFEKYDVSIPSNMDELFTAIDSFRQASVTPISINLIGEPHYWFEYLIYNYTGPSQHALSVPQHPDTLPESWLKGLATFRTLYQKKAFPDDWETTTNEVCLEMFNNKEAAMLLSGSWTTGAIKDMENVRVVPVPALGHGLRQSTDIVGGFSMGFYITAKAWDEKKDAAIRFVEAMTNENALSKFNAGGAASPAPIGEHSNATPLIISAREYIDSATAFVPAVQDSFTEEAREYLFSQIMSIATGEADVKDVLEKFTALENPAA